MNKNWFYISLNSLIIGWSIVWAVALVAKHPNGASILVIILAGKIETITYWAPLYTFVRWIAGCCIITLIICGGRYLFIRSQKFLEHSNESKSIITKDRVVINCLHCGEKLKVPLSEKPISVICPHCDKRFQFRIDPDDKYQSEKSEMYG